MDRTNAARVGVSSSSDRESTAKLSQVRRSEFGRLRDVAYVNCASIGPLPRRTITCLREFNDRRAGPQELSDEGLAAILEGARERAARLINCSPAEIALTTNTGFGINLAARSLPLDAGEVILVPNGEFPTNVYPWNALRTRGVKVELLSTGPHGWPREELLLERLKDSRVKLVAVSLVHFSNGFVLDLKKLGEACRRHGVWLVVDAIQALGQEPFDVTTCPVDILACGGQKWLLSPWGSGFVYVRRELIAQLKPPVIGWLAFEGSDDFTRLTDYKVELWQDARRFELVTLPFQDLLGFSHSLDLLDEVGIEVVRAHGLSLARQLIAGAREVGCEVVSPETEQHQCNIVCVRAAGLEGLYQRLRDGGVVCSLREGSIRFSIHLYNTPDDVDRILGIMSQ